MHQFVIFLGTTQSIHHGCISQMCYVWQQQSDGQFKGINQTCSNYGSHSHSYKCKAICNPRKLICSIFVLMVTSHPWTDVWDEGWPNHFFFANNLIMKERDRTRQRSTTSQIIIIATPLIDHSLDTQIWEAVQSLLKFKAILPPTSLEVNALIGRSKHSAELLVM